MALTAVLIFSKALSLSLSCMTFLGFFTLLSDMLASWHYCKLIVNFTNWRAFKLSWVQADLFTELLVTWLACKLTCLRADLLVSWLVCKLTCLQANLLASLLLYKLTTCNFANFEKLKYVPNARTNERTNEVTGEVLKLLSQLKSFL